MESAKITTQGQVTVPIAVGKKLRIGKGDKVTFAKRGGRLVMANSNVFALKSLQDLFKDETERMGPDDDEAIVRMFKDRRRRKKNAEAGDA
jgi:bifunctional DNA-binding transcriptional regulator/antitoxin component of YhaV-PrlF toxin-antitoxin module